jgi:hypothetical protein
MRLVNLLGSNATGKSTRTFCLYQYLKSKYKQHPINFLSKDKKSGEYVDQQVGVVFENGWFLQGGLSKEDSVWIGLDDGKLPKHTDRYRLFNEINEYNKDCPFEVSTIVIEGYFNNSKSQNPLNVKENCPNLTEVDVFCLYYDTVEEFVDRTNSRAGHCKGLDWALNSAGWKFNESIKGLEQEYDGVVRLDINSPKDWLVHHYFGERFDFVEEKENKPTLF